MEFVTKCYAGPCKYLATTLIRIVPIQTKKCNNVRLDVIPVISSQWLRVIEEVRVLGNLGTIAHSRALKV